MIIFMEHTIKWLQDIGYDTTDYVEGRVLEFKEDYVKLTDKTEES